MKPGSQQPLQDAEFRRISRIKSITHKSAEPLGPQLISFFKHSVQKRQTQMSRIAEVWAKLVPDLLNDHCAAAQAAKPPERAASALVLQSNRLTNYCKFTGMITY